MPNPKGRLFCIAFVLILMLVVKNANAANYDYAPDHGCGNNWDYCFITDDKKTVVQCGTSKSCASCIAYDGYKDATIFTVNIGDTINNTYDICCSAGWKNNNQSCGSQYVPHATIQGYCLKSGTSSGCSGCVYPTTCTDSTISACKAGYYKNTSNTCSSCPSGGTSSDKNTGGITDCYIPVGSTVADTTGSYTFDSNCYYSN
ncbi:MAG: hypothetical protein LBF28_03425 [Rickettsiales bacterium]|jgi:hypothetical protein|nr:hypothetical protein [Rickettsiales bacterium]